MILNPEISFSIFGFKFFTFTYNLEMVKGARSVSKERLFFSIL